MSLNGALIKESLKSVNTNTQYGGIGNFPIALKRGELENLLPTSSAGFCDSVTATETSLVNGFSGGQTLKMTTVGKNLQISSSSIEDAGADTDGVNRINLRYLRSDGTLQSKVLQLTGRTPISITGASDIVAVGIFIAITFGSGAPTDGSASNVGDIWISKVGDTVTDGVPQGDLYGLIRAGHNTTQNGVLLCATGTRLRLKLLQPLSAINGNDTAEIIFNSMSIPLNLVFRTRFPISVGTNPNVDFSLQLDLTGACVFWVNAIRTNGTTLAIGINVNAILDSGGTAT